MIFPEVQIEIRSISQLKGVGGCTHCHAPDAQYYPSMTAYDTHHLDLEVDDNPNSPVFLCSPCYAEYVDYWTALWDEYNYSRG